MERSTEAEVKRDLAVLATLLDRKTDRLLISRLMHKLADQGKVDLASALHAWSWGIDYYGD